MCGALLLSRSLHFSSGVRCLSVWPLPLAPQQLLTLMAQNEADFTSTFRALCSVGSSGGSAGTGGGGEAEEGASELPAALLAAITGGRGTPEAFIALQSQSNDPC
jgi:hypothetical protein